MNMYKGTKFVKARPMTRADYNLLRGWDTPADENPNDEGYLVEYADGGKPNHPAFGGYISWSPSNVFEKSYRDCSSFYFDFSEAIYALKSGLKVARKGWNGKGMFLLLVEGTDEVALRPNSPYAKALYGEGVSSTAILPHIDMYTVDSSGRRAMLCGWLASQTDMLSEDWYIVE